MSLLQDDPPLPQVLLPRFLEILDAVEAAHGQSRSLELTPHAIGLISDHAWQIHPLAEDTEWNRTLLIAAPKYISPETFQANANQPGPEGYPSEVYVLGFMFYEILMGKLAFNREFADFQGPEQQYLQQGKYYQVFVYT